ncbi:hypothetical protein PYW07_017103 [Mythimna separata]|uniref:Peptidase C1A papain C-terminal domain-containing protein n=1 Tax=Mythimna separata TaxID=271217 RepID=A0AAD7YXY5_MYTSE|nr:hypothetical protein PYW07_017103 [Mythimna separata]
MGALKDDDLLAKHPKKEHDPELIASLPESFDARDKWPNCPSLNEIRDQGACGSCWAVAAVAAMTDRYCIYSNGTENFHFSAQDVVSCGAIFGDGCHGDLPPMAWLYWVDEGIVSGGIYNSSQGCRPYEVAPCEHHTSGNLPPCDKIVETPKCLNSCLADCMDYYEEKRHGKEYYILDKEEDIKAELFENGPLEVAFDVYEDFLTYKEGVYKHKRGSKLSGHAVKVLGWGVENDTKYWLIANSWNAHWGDEGYFKILRGENHCGIEEAAIGGVPIIQ